MLTGLFIIQIFRSHLLERIQRPETHSTPQANPTERDPTGLLDGDAEAEQISFFEARPS
jgi:hypothetical protein